MAPRTGEPGGVLRALDRSSLAPALLIGCGVLLRLVQYFSGRSIYLDEAALMLSVRERGLPELLGSPLWFAQTAAPGFLVAQKLTISLFGAGELAIRFVPLLAGLTSLPLFWVLARLTLPRAAALFALALLALSGPLIYFSSNAKPYALDLLTTILVLLCALRWVDDPGRRGSALSLAVVGAAAALLSQPAALTLAAVGAALAGRLVLIGQWKTARPLLSIGICWVVAGIPALLLSTRTLSPLDATYMREFWADGFAPFPPQTLAETAWYGRAFLRIGYDPLGSLVPHLFLLALVLGIVALVRRNRTVLVICTAPIAMALIASMLRLYPFGGPPGGYNIGRVLIFLMPPLLLLVGAGAGLLGASRLFRSRRLLLAVLIVAPVAIATLKEFPFRRDEIRPVLQEVERRYLPGELLYLDPGSRHAFTYYSSAPKLAAAPIIHGGCDLWRDSDRMAAELDRLRGQPRVWVVITHGDRSDGEVLLHRFARIGVVRDSVTAPGAEARLFDFSAADPHTATSATTDLGCQGVFDWETAESAAT